ncbi:serine/threonine protein kinase [Sphingomonas kaistensis]|uniref:Serine/threonine protein kinase n=1 Tax=Sphingomonas kaistensis TaxID=298708 RepID=A0A7X5Y7X3_9SPHN|nr:serine/threonine-protein kinase [Sphingomonas kaistensis]NJC06646.1 serine/threonine protein kinase [Sphingomonas kaistensis]
MSKAYSNKALPPGTVLREWRLEEVLGVGGFGIVYKARGIYFNELVAIKEYFPSAISERDEEATVVPIDSDAEEVHALGLKKFVEEAKLLWNLSTPSRHPNIVSVRSLFEIHGTAYMVMDFEDGTSLSRLLKNGGRFNERSLWDVIAPISEGLDRAHRVGVLHRDIKPPNILITPEGRSVLIDFGSARFDTAEATSTQVTFHTPPYAAIEQYVKTYQQGPWTDIYALGVVLYECVTGTKPPEVLERLHGGQGEPLGSGKWPGYSKKFLAAIDTAMTIKPEERPQSITEWLSLFPQVAAEPEDDERTRFTINEVAVHEIVPVAPPAEAADVPIETNVPDKPEQASFKRAGHETGVARKAAAPAALAAVPESKGEEPAKAPDLSRKPAAAAAKPPAPTPAETKKTPLVAAGIVAAVIAVGAAGWSLLPRTNSDALTESSEPNAAPPAPVTAAYAGPDTGMLAPGLKALAEEARAAGAPDAAIGALMVASDKLGGDQTQLQALLGDPAKSSDAAALQAAMNVAAMTADKAFAAALAEDATMRRQRLAGAAPWTDPGGGGAAPGSAAERTYLARLTGQSSEFQTAAQAVDAAADGAASSSAARELLGRYRAWRSTLASVPTVKLAAQPEAAKLATAKAAATPKAATAAAAQTATTATAAATTSSASSAATASGAKLAEMNGIIDEARGMARQVMRADRGENGRLARGYDDYLKVLKRSARTATTNAQADTIITSAKRTRAYLVFLVKQTQSP